MNTSDTDSALEGLADRMREVLGAASRDETGDTPQLEDYVDLRLIQRGGQGAVYSARQLSTGRRVAIKRFAPGHAADDARQLQRFEREIELAARLVHPNVVPVFDRGTTASGDGWFAMEFIDGQPLDHHARERGLDRSERLALFDRLCKAIGYAHLCGIVHRDLKPENVLVDATGEPRVLDFGIAKPLDEGGATGVTRAGEFLGTLTHAAPEQLLGDPEAVDARTDVHGLGLLLYGLLSDAEPYGEHSTVGQLVQAITERDPPPPTRRGEQPDADLDALVLTCLAKRPQDRYADVDALRRDLAAWREGRPLAARSHHRGYVLRRTLARHRVLVTAVLLVVASLATSTVVSLRALADARVEAVRSENLSDFFVDAVGASIPGMNPAETTLVEWVDRVRREVGTRFPDEPVSEAAVRDAVGSVLGLGGDHAAAEAEFERALDLLRSQGADRGRHGVSVRLHQAALLLQTGRLFEADGLLARVDADVAELPPLDRAFFAPRLAQQRAALLLVLDRSDEAMDELERLLATADESQREQLVPVLADTLRTTGHGPRALELLEDIEASMAARLGEDHVNVQLVRNNTALALADLGRTDEAIERLLDVREKLFAWFGENHAAALRIQLNLAGALRDAGRDDEALPILEDLLARARQHLGEHHVTTLTTLHSLGAILRGRDDLERAETLLASAVDGRTAVLGPGAENTLRSRTELGLTIGRRGDLAEAERLLAAAAVDAVEHLGPANVTTLDVQHCLAVLYVDTLRNAEAAELYAHMVPHADALTARQGVRPGQYRLQRALALSRMGHLEEAVEVLEQARDLYAGYGDAGASGLRACEGLLGQIRRALGQGAPGSADAP